MKQEEQFYDQLKKRLETLFSDPERDNEATRHDLLIYPILTSEFGLRWNPLDLISQSGIQVPEEIKESYIFRGASPKIRKPDILICPNEIAKNVAVIEEKKKQDSLANLSNHRIQLAEYQALYESTWGVLTDGEHWIIKRNFETLHEFSSIDELRLGMADFRNCIGKIEILNRFKEFGILDFVIVSPELMISKSKFPEYEKIPVIICGVSELGITENGIGSKDYPSLKEALSEFPDLHPELNSRRFTWAMKELIDGEIVRLRFETWPANQLYSS